MGMWSDYPDGNDGVADRLGVFLQRYFIMCDDDDEYEKELNFNEEDKYHPGMNNSMKLRMGEAPIFNENDTSKKSMDIYFKLFNFYSLHIDSFTLVGLAICMSRLINNEPYGIFIKEGKKLPVKKCPFAADIKKLISNKIVELDIKEDIKNNILEYFSKK